MNYIDERGETWHIENISPPIPVRTYDWCATHEDYDGAPDANDHRCVYGGEFDDVVEAIDEYVADEIAEETEDRKDEAETLRLETQRRQWQMGTRNTRA